MSTFRTYGVGLNHVGAYQVSGTPYVSSSIPPQDVSSSIRFRFPNVTRRITIKSDSNTDLRIHFAPYDSYDSASYGYTTVASASANYVIIGGGSGSQVFDVKCKEVFISATGTGATNKVYVSAELTSIPAQRMFSLDGIDGVAS